MCDLCKVLTQGSMKTEQIQATLGVCRGELAGKIGDYFRRKSKNLNNLCLDFSSTLAWHSNAVIEVSYRIALSKNPAQLVRNS